MQAETAYNTRRLRERGIPIAYDEKLWDHVVENPFKCERCNLRWDFNCCSADNYKWARDGDHIDEEDYQRIMRYCPSINHSAEPNEWKDDDEKS